MNATDTCDAVSSVSVSMNGGGGNAGPRYATMELEHGATSADCKLAHATRTHNEMYAGSDVPGTPICDGNPVMSYVETVGPPATTV